MVENTSFNDEWNNLQNTFWNNVGSSFTNLPQSASDAGVGAGNSNQSSQSTFFNQWLNDVDKCWQNHAQTNSGDIDSLYKRVSSSSRFFFNFTESMATNQQGETVEVLIEKYLKEFTDKSSVFVAPTVNKPTENEADERLNTNQKDNNSDINSLWKLPLVNWQQQAALFSSQNKSLNFLSSFLGDTADNPEFSAALNAYLIALQEFQREFFNLFIVAAKQTVEALKALNDKPASAKEIMTLWLELLETQYLELIAAEHYSRVYANVVNSWMLVIDKSNKSYAEFMQANLSSAQANANGQ
ncbi:poly(R)-hydroxyalkanoic acid synthase subunit PhaE [uncultured Cocleimonas sp.]|uniref:poly(R)-hydroxyalkanoic acid synthase subunit PhaE n=1 Tax=uncultured Cocleimonas sp. TaxID=1051587 RepID=UPI00260BB928|nr:poly(R)-hydroxyalkanoic acid synthase subunit PhaE [uncultured Cocleimonas sp.]